MEEPKTLNPCPFCGSEKIQPTSAQYCRIVFCLDCAARVSGSTDEEATQKWNKRITQASEPRTK